MLRAIETAAIFVIGLLIDWVGLLNVPGAATFDTSPKHAASITSVGALLALLTFGCWLTIFVRRKYPLATATAGLVLAIVGVSYLLLLIGTYHALLRWPKKTLLITLASGTAIGLYLIRETLTDWGGALSWIFEGGAKANDVAWVITSLVIAAISIALVITLAIYQRTKLAASNVNLRTKELDKRARELDVELANQSERDRIARDLHDGLGHRLSSIALAASAFESQAANTQVDSELTTWARLVRQQAHAALEDVREVVGGLRAEQRTPGIESGVSVRQATQLLTDLRAAGHKIEAYVFIENIERIDRARDVAAFRILQEALTNAIKHAPGATISVTLEVHPNHDLRVRVGNELKDAFSDVPSSQLGIGGIRERAAEVGGQAWIGPHEGYFIVNARLPWE